VVQGPSYLTTVTLRFHPDSDTRSKTNKNKVKFKNKN
jgi:hypothetical protein